MTNESANDGRAARNRTLRGIKRAKRTGSKKHRQRERNRVVREWLPERIPYDKKRGLG